MPLNAAALDIGGEAIAAAITHAIPFTSVPNAGGTNFITGATRTAVDIDSTDGSLSLAAPVTFTGLGADVTVGYIGYFTAPTGGTFLGYSQRTTGDAKSNAAGEYILNSISIPASAT